MAPTPITILTGFLGSGKTTTIIKLLPQLPPTYKLALLKNEFGDNAVDSELAAASSISGVREMLNGCICCNLVGQLGDALDTLRDEQNPDRIVIETSGSAFPATLAMEVNRLARESNGERFVLDGVVSVIDVENWQGYEDTSPTSRMQAQYTDFVVFNKWENVSERRFDECLDRLGDLELETPWVKSDKGKVGKEVILGLDGALARDFGSRWHESEGHQHGEGQENHQSEVEVLSIILRRSDSKDGAVDQKKLQELLQKAPKEEVYRIKGLLYASSLPENSSGEEQPTPPDDVADGEPSKYILNWAFGRWTFTSIAHMKEKAHTSHGLSTPPAARDETENDPVLRMTLIFARDESTKWRKRIEKEGLLAIESVSRDDTLLNIDRVL